MLKGILLFLFLICCFFNLRGQDTLDFDLRACLDYGLENSYLRQSDRIEAKERLNEYNTAKRRFLPQIDLYAKYHNYFNDLPTYIFPSEEGGILSGGTSEGPYPVELGLPHNLNAAVHVNQVIFDRNFILIDDFNRNLEKLDLLKEQLSKETIIYDITLNYYTLASMYAKKELLQYNLERLARIERLLDTQIENGFARPYDKGKIEINRTGLMAGMDQIDAGISQMQQYLKFLMGMPVDQEIHILIEDPDVQPGQIADHYPDSLANTEEALLDTQIDLYELEKDKMKSDYFLKLSAFARFRVQAQREAFNFFQGNQDWFLINLFGVRLDIPIYHGGIRNKQMESSNIKSSKVRLSRIQLQESLKMQFENARFEVNNAMKNIEYNKKNVETSKFMYDQTAALFEEGLTMLTDLLEVESIYREAENELITATYNYKIAELKFLKSTGNLFTYMQDL